jgi:hemerythrin
MDDQHGILMDAINALRLALVRGAGRERISELLDEFIEFTRMHFWSEEQLMEQTGFVGLEEHRAEHHRMLADILQSAHRLQYGRGVQLRPLLCDLHHGFLHHIETMDQKYVPWLHERGVN